MKAMMKAQRRIFSPFHSGNKPIIKKGISYAPTSLKDFKLFSKVKNSIKNLKRKSTKFLWLQINLMFQEVKLKKKL